MDLLTLVGARAQLFDIRALHVIVRVGVGAVTGHGRNV